jgi:hypothetical protein
MYLLLEMVVISQCRCTENLAAGTGNSYTIASAVKSWTDEVCASHRAHNLI